MLIDDPRFTSKFIPEPMSGCWLWMGASDQRGYGQLYSHRHGRTMRVTRILLEEIIGIIPEAICACHKCDNPYCVNPKHLFPGTQRDNAIDSARKGRRYAGGAYTYRNREKTHCKYGHPFSLENTIVRPHGQRGCRICNTRLMKEAYARRCAKAEADQLEKEATDGR